MSQQQPPTDNATPPASADTTQATPNTPSKKWRTAWFIAQIVLLTIKGLIVFLLLFGGANPAVVYQRF